METSFTSAIINQNRNMILGDEGFPISLNISSPYNKPFLRKPKFKEDDDLFALEQMVADILMKNPVDNVVDVYCVSNNYIDYQLLDTSKELDLDDPVVQRDIKNGLLNLHELGIVYIDLKPDNIGYDHESQSWKIFDFNVSGIMDPETNQWIYPPPEYYRYREIKSWCKFAHTLLKICGEKNLTKYDKLSYYLTFKKDFDEV